ncbi:MAG: hypothetical protein Q8K86_01575 [Candidatus Nanopelagicaceae bacterium]|nr:hypothetical protein [Candidatus Nanopelagicaceae bacterium]
MARLYDYLTINLIKPPKTMSSEDIAVWFIENQNLTVMQQARILKRSIQMVWYWHRKLRLTKPNPFHDPGRIEAMKRAKLAKGVVPNSEGLERLDDEKWLEERYLNRRWSIRNFAEALGCGGAEIIKALKKFNLMSENECRSRAWLHEHYYDKKLGVEQCARLAGVQPETIFHWLAKFNIPVKMKVIRCYGHEALVAGEDEEPDRAVARNAGFGGRVFGQRR